MTYTETCHDCARPLRGNPNNHQCESCGHIFCSRHQRLVEWGIRICTRCKPPERRRRRSRWTAR